VTVRYHVVPDPKQDRFLIMHWSGVVAYQCQREIDALKICASWNDHKGFETHEALMEENDDLSF